MSDTNGQSADLPAWKSEKAPCVYCGREIERSADRCPECRTSFSFAVRKASREVVGDWFYLDSRNPSGRGVTFETLIKMIEKGRIRADSVVRGPNTHHDWMYAAEAPRLAKYLGMCPHCFAEAKPADTYCTSCQLNMNARPAEARPGIPPELIKDPLHAEAYRMEERLASAATGPAAAAGQAPPTPPPAPVSVTRPEPAPAVSAAAAAAAAMADVGAASSDRPSRVQAAPRHRKPKIWIILLLTWLTLIPILVVGYFLQVPLLYDGIRAVLRLGDEPVDPPPPVDPSSQPDHQWLQTRLGEADQAVQAKDYAGAIRIYQDIIAKTGDTSWQSRIEDLRRRPEQERQVRLTKLKGWLELAERLAGEKRYDDALARLRNIGQEDRTWLASLGVSVEKMEQSIQANQAREVAAAKQEQMLVSELQAAAKLRTPQTLAQALAAYQKIEATYPGDLIAKHVDLATTLVEIQQQIAALTPEPTPPQPTPPDPTLTPEKAAEAIADLLAEAAAFEAKEKFAEALEKLEEIKTTFDQKYWPDALEERIRQVKAKKEALEFFGME